LISSERSQNVIVSFFIIVAVVSSVFLVGNAQYYGGSYVLAASMEVSIVDSTVSNIDPTNESVYPVLSFTFNFRTDSPTEGNVRLVSISATPWLNDDHLSFTVLSRTITNDPNQLFHPGYDSNFTLTTTLNSNADRTSIIQADTTDTWNWYVRLTYSFITFDDARSRISRVLYLNWTGAIIVI
jgi:hypothetical protein